MSEYLNVWYPSFLQRLSSWENTTWGMEWGLAGGRIPLERPLPRCRVQQPCQHTCGQGALEVPGEQGGHIYPCSP